MYVRFIYVHQYLHVCTLIYMCRYINYTRVSTCMYIRVQFYKGEMAKMNERCGTLVAECISPIAKLAF